MIYWFLSLFHRKNKRRATSKFGSYLRHFNNNHRWTR